jgi:hypothetical protein
MTANTRLSLPETMALGGMTLALFWAQAILFSRRWSACRRAQTPLMQALALLSQRFYSRRWRLFPLPLMAVILRN